MDRLLLFSAIAPNRRDERFEALYYEYRQLMFAVANGVLRDEALAEDAVQQAFLKLFENIDHIPEICCPKTKGFVVIIVRRAAIDLYRKRKRQNELSFDEIGEALGGAAEPEEGFGLTEAIMKLPETYSSPLLLKYSHGCSDREIAQILNLTLENVRKRITRAKKRLSEMLAEQGVHDVGR